MGRGRREARKRLTRVKSRLGYVGLAPSSACRAPRCSCSFASSPVAVAPGPRTPETPRSSKSRNAAPCPSPAVWPCRLRLSPLVQRPFSQQGPARVCLLPDAPLHPTRLGVCGGSRYCRTPVRGREDTPVPGTAVSPDCLSFPFSFLFLPRHASRPVRVTYKTSRPHYRLSYADR